MFYLKQSCCDILGDAVRVDYSTRFIFPQWVEKEKVFYLYFKALFLKTPVL